MKYMFYIFKDPINSKAFFGFYKIIFKKQYPAKGMFQCQYIVHITAVFNRNEH